jgi:hypothetical protein
VSTTTSPDGRVRALRANALAGLIMLLIEYSLGISANLYSALPPADRNKSLFAGLGAAVGNGPVIVTLHALLGTLLLVTAAAAVLRASLLGARALIALSGGALVATLIAWLSGTAFVGHQTAGASLSMALAAAMATLCYALIIFTLGVRWTAPPANPA